MSTLVLCFLAASGGTTLGVLLGACLAGGKLKDLEIAYSELSLQVHQFLSGLPPSDNDAQSTLVSDEELSRLQNTLERTDEAMGLRSCHRKFDHVALGNSCLPTQRPTTSTKR